MGKISDTSKYVTVTPASGDLIIGTDVSDSNNTKSYTMQSISDFTKANLSLSSSLLLSSSSTSNQEPSGLDTVLQVTFGAASGSASDPVQLAADGTITFNEAGLYLFNGFGNFERQGSSGGVSVTLFRALINGSQVGVIKAVELDSTGVMIPYEVTTPIQASAADTLTWEILRDSSGVDQGGLYTHTNLSAWDDVPSASINIYRLSV